MAVRGGPPDGRELLPTAAKVSQIGGRIFQCLVGLSPNVSQLGRVAAKSSSSRRRRQVKIRKSSCGPSSAVLLVVLARGFGFLVRERHTIPPDSLCSATGSRYLFPFSNAELRLATVGAPGGIAPGKDSRLT